MSAQRQGHQAEHQGVLDRFGAALGKSPGIDIDAYAPKLDGAAVGQLDRRQVSGLSGALKRETGRAT